MCRPAVPLETAAAYGAPTRSREQLLEALDRRPERQPAGAEHLENELFLALVQVRASRAERASRSSRLRWRRVPDLRVLEPLRPALALAAARVEVRRLQLHRHRPRRPISWSSTSRIGVTSAAVPVMKTSSAVARSVRIRFFSSTV